MVYITSLPGGVYRVDLRITLLCKDDLMYHATITVSVAMPGLETCVAAAECRPGKAI